MNLNRMQTLVFDWASECFGHDQATDPKIRALRLVEESVEFAQAVGVDQAKLAQLVEYVYSRPVGEVGQELGGVGITFLAASAAVDRSAAQMLKLELNRILKKAPEYFAARNQKKIELGFA